MYAGYTARAFCHLYLALTYLLGGEIQRALEESRAIVSTAEQSGDRLAAYIGYGIRARVESQSGQHENARSSMTQQQAIAQSLGEQRMIIDDWFAAIKAKMRFMPVVSKKLFHLRKKQYAQPDRSTVYTPKGWPNEYRLRPLPLLLRSVEMKPKYTLLPVSRLSKQVKFCQK